MHVIAKLGAMTIAAAIGLGAASATAQDKKVRIQMQSNFASTLALPPTQLAYAYQAAGDEPRMARNLELAFELSPNPALASALSQVRMRPLLPPVDSP